MKILVVCQHYWPEPFNTSDVCEKLVKRGHSVSVITGLPNTGMPNSDIPILQEDGSVASLEEIMTRNAEMDSSLDSASSDSADNGDVSLLTDETDTLGDVNVDTGNLSESVGEPIHMTQSDVEWYIENANDSESLRQMRDGIASGRIR